MCHARVNRVSKVNGAEIEYLKSNGDWTTKPEEANEISEEDARSFVRILRKGNSPDFDFDYATIEA